mgnify:CR=1 FL=1|tara:strand:+ start:563 stop:871 length:309 start_codon:yes stop_codon:yes gene_type:complete
MQNKLFDQHKDCEMVVNYTRKNAHDRPSLCCATHKDKKGRPQWIDWISHDEEDYLVEGLCLEVIVAEPLDLHAVMSFKVPADWPKNTNITVSNINDYKARKK